MAYPSSLSDYFHSVQWSSITSSLPTDPRACLTSISASSFCCLPYLPFWPFSRFTDYSDLDVDDNISTSSSTWQAPQSALNSFSSSSASSSFPALMSSSSSSTTSFSSSSALRVSQPVAQPVFSSHLASSTFSSPDQLASIIVRQHDEHDKKRHRSADKDKKRKDESTATHALTSDMHKSRDSERSSTQHKQPYMSKGKKLPHSERRKGGDKEKKGREAREQQDKSRTASVPRSALSSSPVSLSHSVHQDEDMSDSELSDLSSSDDEQLMSADRHERALIGSSSKPAAIY